MTRFLGLVFAFFILTLMTSNSALAKCNDDMPTAPDCGSIESPSTPGPEIIFAPSFWYGYIDRNGPLFKNGTAHSVGIVTGRFRGPIDGFTVTIVPNLSNIWTANTAIDISAYYAKETGSFSAVYYKTVTNDEDNNWWGHGHEVRQDYEVLVLKELLPMNESAGSSSASVLALGGVRYIDIGTSILGEDIFQNQLTYNRQNKFYLGEAGFRFAAPFASGWRLMLGGTALFGATYDQNGEVCGCGDVERDTRRAQADGYDVYGGISVIPHELYPMIPEGISLTLRYRDRSLYTKEQGELGIDHQYGPEFTFVWQFPTSRGGS